VERGRQIGVHRQVHTYLHATDGTDVKGRMPLHACLFIGYIGAVKRRRPHFFTRCIVFT